MLGFLGRLEKLHAARTEAERAAVYRFRYDVYVAELKYRYPEADHERRWLKQPADDEPGTTLLYSGSPEQVTGTVRVRAWRPGQVPAADFERLSLGLFPGVEGLTVAHLGRLMIRRTLRGKLLLPSLLVAGYEFLAGEERADLAFLDCLPGLVRYYRRLGARPFGGKLLDLGYGPGIPLVIVLSDDEHLRKCGSPVAPLVKKYFGPGRRPALDVEPFRDILEGEALPVELDPAKVWAEIQSRLLAAEARLPSFVDQLAPKAVKKLASSGFLLDVEAGAVVTREGIEEREMYVVLDGLFEVEAGGKRLGTLERGDLFGEVAFFTEAGERTATVRALVEGRVLVLRRKFLEELAESDPDAAFQLLMNTSRIMAERLAANVPRLA